MLAILGATRALVAQSIKEGWSDESTSECVQVLDGMMASIIDPTKNCPPEFSCIQFAPTGPIQEIAMANGWHDTYMNLSAEYDRLEEELKLFQVRNG